LRGIIKETGEPLPEFKLRIDGMHCGSCIRRVSQALATARGIVVDEVHVGGAKVTSSLDPLPVDLALAAIAKAGFTAHLDS
jgi:copper chaperone CopZ